MPDERSIQQQPPAPEPPALDVPTDSGPQPPATPSSPFAKPTMDMVESDYKGDGEQG